MTFGAREELLSQLNGAIMDASSSPRCDVVEDRYGNQYPYFEVNGGSANTVTRLLEIVPGIVSVEVVPAINEFLRVPLTDDNSVTLRTSRLGAIVSPHEQFLITNHEADEPVGLPDATCGFLRDCLKRGVLQIPTEGEERLYPLINSEFAGEYEDEEF